MEFAATSLFQLCPAGLWQGCPDIICAKHHVSVSWNIQRKFWNLSAMWGPLLNNLQDLCQGTVIQNCVSGVKQPSIRYFENQKHHFSGSAKCCLLNKLIAATWVFTLPVEYYGFQIPQHTYMIDKVLECGMKSNHLLFSNRMQKIATISTVKIITEPIYKRKKKLNRQKPGSSWKCLYL